MSIECSECERDARAGHDPSCSRWQAPLGRTSVPVPGEQHLWPIHADAYHEFIANLCENMPEEWDDDVAVESIILKYVRHLESRVPPDKRRPTTEEDVQRAVMLADIDACDEFD